MSDIAIKVENISKKYLIGESKNYPTLRDKLVRLPSQLFKAPKQEQEFWALRDVSFEVKRGEVVGVIGRNGAGKSTLLKILARITEPTEGQVTMYGRVASMLEVGTGFNPELTGRENIYLNGAIIGMTKAEIRAKFDEIVEFSGVGKFLDTPVKHYSSGMYVRLAFAVAAHLDADILLVDEVLAVGDADFQKKCLNKMSDLASSGKTVIIVSHNMSAISSLCHKLIHLKNGRLATFAIVKIVITKYLESLTKKSSINLSKFSHEKRIKAFSELLHFSITNGELIPSNTFRMGDSITITIKFRIKKLSKQTELGIKISSYFGTPIHYIVSTWEGLNPTLSPGMYTYRTVIPQIFLLPGRYVLGAWILRGNEPADDTIQDITSIDIVSSNITGHDANFDRYAYSGSEVYLPSTWSKLE